MSDPTNKPINAQDLEDMTEMWADSSSRAGFACDRAIEEAQDHAYKLGYARGLKDAAAAVDIAVDDDDAIATAGGAV